MQATGKKPPSEWVSCGSSRGEKVMHPGKSGVQRTLSPVSLAKKKRTAQTMCCRSRNAERRIKKPPCRRFKEVFSGFCSYRGRSEQPPFELNDKRHRQDSKRISGRVPDGSHGICRINNPL